MHTPRWRPKLVEKPVPSSMPIPPQSAYERARQIGLMNAQKIARERIEQIYQMAVRGFRRSCEPIETTVEKRDKEGNVVSRKVTVAQAKPDRKLLEVILKLAKMRKEMAGEHIPLDHEVDLSDVN